MKAKFAVRLACTIAAAVLAAVSLGGIAQALTDTVFRYTTPKTGWYGLDPAAFFPEDSTYAVNNYEIGSGSLGAGATSCFSAGVNLPHGATITTITTWYRGDATGGVGLFLYRNNIATGARELVGSETSQDTSLTRKQIFVTAPANVAVVNNQKFVYAVELCLVGSNSRFFGTRINYTYNNAGD